MTATRRLVLDLPEEQVAMIEARVAAGEYESVSAFVAARIEDEFALPIEHQFAEDSPQMKAWLEDGDEIVRRIDAGLEPLIPAEDVFDKLKAELRTMLAKEERAKKRA